MDERMVTGRRKHRLFRGVEESILKKQLDKKGEYSISHSHGKCLLEDNLSVCAVSNSPVLYRLGEGLRS
ncbi:hypothetical protein C2W62_05440 [Candidatus Entotheonella serta]|nr:hypothetical protein C2W62_05440 [Candidatus Entotheonella serta]